MRPSQVLPHPTSTPRRGERGLQLTKPDVDVIAAHTGESPSTEGASLTVGAAGQGGEGDGAMGQGAAGEAAPLLAFDAG